MVFSQRARETEFERRKHVRTSVGLPAIVRADGKDYSVRIADIGPEGAMLETSARLHPGDSLSLRCGSIVADAMVVWARGWQIGVNFAYPLNERELAEQLSRTAAIASRRLLKRSS